MPAQVQHSIGQHLSTNNTPGAAASFTLFQWAHGRCSLPHKTEVHPKAPVHTGTGQADEHTIGHRGPGGIPGWAVKADLQASHTAY